MNDTTSKAIGNDAIAKELSHLLEYQLSTERLLKAIEHYGAPKVDAAARKISQQMKTSKIANLASSLNKMILRGQVDEKTSKIERNQPSLQSQFLDENKDSQEAQKLDSSAEIGNKDDIDSLRKEKYWPLPWNKTFYRRLSRDNRQPIVSEVFVKWPYLQGHAQHMKIDLLSDEFTDHPLFKNFSDVINSIRFEVAAHHLRSKLWNET